MIKPMDITDTIVIDRQALEDENTLLFFEMYDIITNCKDEEWYIAVLRRADVYITYLDLLGIDLEESRRYQQIVEMYELRFKLGREAVKA